MSRQHKVRITLMAQRLSNGSDNGNDSGGSEVSRVWQTSALGKKVFGRSPLKPLG